MFKNVQTAVLYHSKISSIGETLSPVSSAAADIGESLSSPHIHIKAVIKSAGVLIILLSEMVEA